MSHWTNIKTQVRDLLALRDAVLELGLRLEQGNSGQRVKARGYAGNEIECDAVIRCKGPYDVALNRQPDGTYQMTCDWYHGHIAKECGEGFKRVLQMYGVAATTRQARKQGLRVHRTLGSHGAINLVLTGASL